MGSCSGTAGREGCLKGLLCPLLFRPLEELDWIRVAERVLKLSIPVLYVWLCMFYCLFHLWLNIIAELLRFGDRRAAHARQRAPMGWGLWVQSCQWAGRFHRENRAPPRLLWPPQVVLFGLVERNYAGRVLAAVEPASSQAGSSCPS